MPDLDDTIVGDIGDHDACLRATKGVDAVVHLAGVPSGGSPWQDVLRANFDGTYQIMEAARQSGVHRVAFASRAGLLGQGAIGGQGGGVVQGRTRQSGVAGPQAADPIHLGEAALLHRLQALELDAEVEARFRDEATGLLYDTPADGDLLVIRPREIMDMPLPSGTSQAAELKLRLGRLLGDDERVRAAWKIVGREGGGIEQMPSGFGRLLTVALRLAYPPLEVAIFGRRGDPQTRELLCETHRRFARSFAAGIVGGISAWRPGWWRPRYHTN